MPLLRPPPTGSESPGQSDWLPIYGGGGVNTSVTLKKLAHEYLSMLLALLPLGHAWNRNVQLDTQSPAQPRTLLQSLLLGFCHEMERFDKRNDDLMNEKDPNTTFEMITDWERICGIPDECSALTTTIEQRREVVLLKIAGRGGSSKAYFLELADFLGWPNVTITEYPPATIGLMNCNSQLTTSSAVVPEGDSGGEGWSFVWAVENTGQKITWFRSGSGASGDNISIEETEDNRLKCYFNLLQPAHTKVIFPPWVA